MGHKINNEIWAKIIICGEYEHFFSTIILRDTIQLSVYTFIKLLMYWLYLYIFVFKLKYKNYITFMFLYEYK